MHFYQFRSENDRLLSAEYVDDAGVMMLLTSDRVLCNDIHHETGNRMTDDVIMTSLLNDWKESWTSSVQEDGSLIEYSAASVRFKRVTLM